MQRSNETGEYNIELVTLPFKFVNVNQILLHCFKSVLVTRNVSSKIFGLLIKLHVYLKTKFMLLVGGTHVM